MVPTDTAPVRIRTLFTPCSMPAWPPSCDHVAERERAENSVGCVGSVGKVATAATVATQDLTEFRSVPTFHSSPCVLRPARQADKEVEHAKIALVALVRMVFYQRYQLYQRKIQRSLARLQIVTEGSKTPLVPLLPSARGLR